MIIDIFYKIMILISLYSTYKIFIYLVNKWNNFVIEKNNLKNSYLRNIMDKDYDEIN